MRIRKLYYFESCKWTRGERWWRLRKLSQIALSLSQLIVWVVERCSFAVDLNSNFTTRNVLSIQKKRWQQTWSDSRDILLVTIEFLCLRRCFTLNLLSAVFGQNGKRVCERLSDMTEQSRLIVKNKTNKTTKYKEIESNLDPIQFIRPFPSFNRSTYLIEFYLNPENSEPERLWLPFMLLKPFFVGKKSHGITNFTISMQASELKELELFSSKGR
jgi:hypothetical protein